jgi:hypothetical protein
MMTNFELLKQLVESGGNCVNLGRHMQSASPVLYQWVMDQTTFLDHKPLVKFNERAYCILNHITEPKIDAWGKEARFVNLFLGYSLKVTTKTKAMNKKPPRVKKLREKVILSKIEVFRIRNRKRNKHLYADDLVEGVDYLVCPVSQERVSVIGSHYIRYTLEMDPKEYWRLYPNLPNCSPKRHNNIKRGLSKIDNTTGLTKHALSIHKSNITKRLPDENGETVYQKIARKTKAAHLTTIDEYGRNGYQRLSHYRTNTLLPNGRTVEQEAHRKRSERIAALGVRQRRYGASKISKRILAPVLQYCIDNNLSYYFDTNEFVVRDQAHQRNYLYDLVIPAVNMVIEYQSKRYHPWPTMNVDEWNTWIEPYSNFTADQKHDYELTRARAIFKKHGHRMWYVWETSYQTDIEGILCWLATVNTKS